MLLNIVRRSGVAIQEQLYEQIRRAIEEGRLQPGDRLPSTRSLAAQLGIARGTVSLSYTRLSDEGYLVLRGQSGTSVSLRARPMAIAATSVARKTAKPRPHPQPFQFGVPALDLFPRKVWARQAGREARRLSVEALAYPDPMGHLGLREAIAAYLIVARGVACRADQILITTGYQAALNLVASLVLTAGDEVWIEEPGYGFTQNALRALSMKLAPVCVDDEGLRVEIGVARHPAARLAVTTPAHQFPLGVTLSLARRQALLAWASDNQSWILEDDYDSEFHYIGRRPPALKSLDAQDRVFYAGSFSKVLFPGLRLGYLVLPEAFIAGARRASEMLNRGGSYFDQAVTAAFMTDGHFHRHLRRMRNAYAGRRAALAAELTSQFGRDVEFSLTRGGLHLLARFPRFGPDVSLAARARDHGLSPTPLSGQFVGERSDEGLLMSFTNIAESSARDVVGKLRQAIAA